MMKTEEKKPSNPNAFPVHQNINSDRDCGMTLRDFFANSAMQGMITAKLNDPNFSLGVDNNNNNIIAIVSYELADAMLKQREL